MSEAFGVRSFLRTWAKPARDRQYLKWIKSLWCLGCGRNWNIDPAHTGPHGVSQKASDYSCIPLCRDCHRAYDRAPHAFAINHGWELSEILAFYHHCYWLKTGRHVWSEQERRAA